jgi:hypothetical protein
MTGADARPIALVKGAAQGLGRSVNVDGSQRLLRALQGCEVGQSAGMKNASRRSTTSVHGASPIGQARRQVTADPGKPEPS